MASGRTPVVEALRAQALALGVAALLLGTFPAAAQNAGQATNEVDVWFGCPAGQVIKTTPDPRPGMAQRPVVRCTTRSQPVAPNCSRGMAVTVARGADACAPATITDGTSNTVQFGERGSGTNLAMGDGSVRTVSTTIPRPTCLAPAVLVADFEGDADSCLVITVTAPLERVRVAAPQ